ncbi:MAG TPA: class I SAM-dependent methyltransferase [Solirubrobacteraceae bacterium]|jgi:SAM-dependent methyltransferase
MTLTPEALDTYADTYYLNAAIADVDIEELGQRRSIARTVEAIGDAKRVLEMGYGTGLVTGELLARGVPIEVLEGSPKLCAIARERHRSSGLVVHEALFEQFAAAQPYDAVLAMHIAEHVDDPVGLFETVREWLAPGGAIIVVVPNAQSLHRRLAVRMGLQQRLDDLSPRDQLVGHQRVYDLSGLRADLAVAGFVTREEFGYQLKTVPNSMMADWPEDLLAALIDISGEIPPAMLANIGIRATRP